MIPLLENLSLSERQRLYYNGSHCVYCGNPTEYVDSIEVYQASYGMIFLCRRCMAFVNTHPGSPDQSFGFVAKADLRQARHHARQAFDPLVNKKVELGMKRKLAQAKAREWLANILNIDVVECHMGMMDMDQCRRVVDVCKPFHLTEDQVKERESNVQYRIETVNFLAQEMGFSLQEFKINAMLQLELKRHDGKILYYHPRKKEARWSHRKKPFKVEDIEDFIEKHFQPI